MSIVDQATTVRKGEEIDAGRLGGYLQVRVPGLAGELAISQFPSGYSNLTYQVQAGEREMVLRRPPIGAKVDKGHDMEREYRVLSALHPVFPRCPRPLVYCGDPELIGAPFFVMEKMAGVILRKDLPPGLALAPAQARALCENLTDTLVEIHAIDMQATGLEALGRPDGYVRRQVEGWSGRYRKARTEDAPDCEPLMAWLAANMPEDSAAPTMVHNDYKMDNLVLAPGQTDRITGILDWEMATYGDPLMDLGNSLAYWVSADDPEEMQLIRSMPTHLPGMLSREEIVRRYGARTGRDMSNFLYYYCFGLFRLAVIAQQIYHRYYHGVTTNKRFATLIFAVRALDATALRAIRANKF